MISRYTVLMFMFCKHCHTMCFQERSEHLGLIISFFYVTVLYNQLWNFNHNFMDNRQRTALDHRNEHDRFDPRDLLLPLTLVPVVANLEKSGRKINQQRLLAWLPKLDVGFFSLYASSFTMIYSPVQHFSCIQLSKMGSVNINQRGLT